MHSSMETFVKGRLSAAKISAPSLIITLFGDCFSQHGGSIWLGSLIDILKSIGISERVVRTTVFRLVQDDLLQTEKIGRCSYYSFSDNGIHHYERTSGRIYSNNFQQEEKFWTLILTHQIDDIKINEFKKGLSWLGFGQLRPGLFAHPTSNLDALEDLTISLDVKKDIISFQAQIGDLISELNLKHLVFENWGLDSLKQNYQTHCNLYRPFLKRLSAKVSAFNDYDCFILRTILIHEYRRILLRDPDLPANMLDANWPGVAAQDVTLRIYKQIAQKSQRFIVDQLNNAQGTLPPASPSFTQRFGGFTI